MTTNRTLGIFSRGTILTVAFGVEGSSEPPFGRGQTVLPVARRVVEVGRRQLKFLLVEGKSC